MSSIQLLRGIEEQEPSKSLVCPESGPNLEPVKCTTGRADLDLRQVDGEEIVELERVWHLMVCR